MTTLSGLNIGDDCTWLDRGDWPAIQRADRRTIGGGIVFQPRRKLAGRPITISIGNTTTGWPTLATVDALRAFRDSDAIMLLDMGTLGTYTVRFTAGDDSVEAIPVVGILTDTDPADLYDCTIRLMEV